MKKTWIYGLDCDGEVIKKDWCYGTLSDVNRDHLTQSWEAFGCTRIFVVEESTDLRDCWFDYIKTRYSRNGLHAFARLEFVDFLEREGTELAKAA